MNNVKNEELGDADFRGWDLSLVTSLGDDNVSTPSSSEWDLSLVTSLSDDNVATPSSSNWDIGEEK